MNIRFSIKALVFLTAFCAIAAHFASPLFETSLQRSFSDCDMIGDYYLVYGEREMELTWAIAFAHSCPIAWENGEVTLQDGTEISINDDSVTYVVNGNASTVPLSLGSLHVLDVHGNIEIIDSLEGISISPELVCFGDSEGTETDISAELYSRLDQLLDRLDDGTED